MADLMLLIVDYMGGRRWRRRVRGEMEDIENCMSYNEVDEMDHLRSGCNSPEWHESQLNASISCLETCGNLRLFGLQ